MRSTSASSRPKPATTAAHPTARKVLPLVVSALISARMAVLRILARSRWPAGQRRAGNGSRATMPASTCSGSWPATRASGVGSNRCASTGTARACTSSGIT